MERFGLPLVWVGVWGALRFGGDVLGSLLAELLSPYIGQGRGWRMTIALTFSGSVLLLSSVLPGLWGTPLYLAYYLMMAALTVIFETRLQHASSNECRASLLSVFSLLLNLSAIGIMPILGVLGKAYGLVAIVRVCGLLTIFPSFLFMRKSEKKRGATSQN